VGYGAAAATAEVAAITAIKVSVIFEACELAADDRR
jgi:hypothetical protein